MSQEIFPEIQAATEAMEKRIALTEAEIEQLKDSISSKRQLARALRKALTAVAPKESTRKKKVAPS